MALAACAKAVSCFLRLPLILRPLELLGLSEPCELSCAESQAFPELCGIAGPGLRGQSRRSEARLALPKASLELATGRKDEIQGMKGSQEAIHRDLGK